MCVPVPALYHAPGEASLVPPGRRSPAGHCPTSGRPPGHSSGSRPRPLQVPAAREGRKIMRSGSGWPAPTLLPSRSRVSHWAAWTGGARRHRRASGRPVTAQGGDAVVFGSRRTITWTPPAQPRGGGGQIDPSLPKTPNLEARLRLKFCSCCPGLLKAPGLRFPRRQKPCWGGHPPGCPGLPGRSRPSLG